MGVKLCRLVTPFNRFPNKPLLFFYVSAAQILEKKKKKNRVGKGEIARIEQFLLFLQCFLPFWKTSRHFYQV